MLTGCGDSSADSSKSAVPSAAESVDCTSQTLSQADWMANCSESAGTGGDGSGTGAEGTDGAETLAWGKPAQTIGAQSPADGTAGGEPLEVTPTTIVYQKGAMGMTAVNGLYAIITVKDRAPGAAAAESAPIEGGGWQWIAPDGQALSAGDGEASSITPQGFTGGGTIPAGAWKWRTIAFDISEAQRAGTLVYTDGTAVAFQWTVPAKDSGPEVSKLKKGMEGEY
ncbi:hypothetical protein [Streptomyces sp. NPDC088766]|uniref:hypothetical protein n=1 Tax=Streptomyces sp. NPDC088766 TaxID=3365893 RepID=UPI003828D730